jgi:hypothetical protein
MPKAHRKSPSKPPNSNLSSALLDPSLLSQASPSPDVPLHCQTSNNGDNESNSAASERSWTSSNSRQSTKARRRKIANEKKLENVLQYLANSRITFERLLTELYLNRRKHGKEWAGVKKFAFQREDVLKDLSIKEWEGMLGQVEWSPVHAILRKEVQALSRTRAFGEFDPDESLESLDDMVDEKEVRQYAPHFLDLIYTVGKPIKKQSRGSKSPIKPVGTILSMMCFNMQRKKSNSFPLNLGLFLQKNGLTRSGLETTCALGLTCSYGTIKSTVTKMVNENVDEVRQVGELPTAIPAYDNLEFNFGVREARDGDMSKFSSVTTGLVHKGVEIPEEGLKRSWFKPKYELQTTDILPIYNRDRMQQQERRRNKVKEPVLCLYNILNLY